MNNAANTGGLIEIKVRYLSIVADLVGKREERLMMPANCDLNSLVALIGEQHPAFADYARRNDPAAGSALRIFRNGRQALDMAEPLADGDELWLFPVISGG